MIYFVRIMTIAQNISFFQTCIIMRYWDTAHSRKQLFERRNPKITCILESWISVWICLLNFGLFSRGYFESGIDVGPGKFVKKKLRALNKRRAQHEQNVESYVTKNPSNLKIFVSGYLTKPGAGDYSKAREK